MSKRYKLAYLVSHPIQYQAPLLRYIAANSDIDLTVFFLSDFSIRGYQDAEFKATVQWDVPLLEGYKHVFLPALGGAEKLTPFRPFSYNLRRYLKAGQFDALWLHGYSHPSNLRAMIAAKLLGIPVLLRSDIQQNSAFGTGIKRKIKEAVIRRLFALANGFLAAGTLNKEYYQHYGVSQEKIFLMPYAVDNCFFQAKAEAARPNRETLRQALNLETGRPIILYASKFIARKRAADALEAYIRLSSDGAREPKPYLLFVGDGEERPRLEERVNQLGWNSVRFLGFKNQTELPAYYDLCDVFVLVSEREPWGLIVNEVMNAGKPVIVSDQVGSAPDLVRDGENGFVVPVGDITMLAERFSTLTEDPKLAAKMGQLGLLLIRQWGFAENLTALQDAIKYIAPR